MPAKAGIHWGSDPMASRLACRAPSQELLGLTSTVVRSLQHKDPLTHSFFLLAIYGKPCLLPNRPNHWGCAISPSKTRKYPLLLAIQASGRDFYKRNSLLHSPEDSGVDGKVQQQQA